MPKQQPFRAHLERAERGLHRREQGAGAFRVGFVLDREVRPVALLVLGTEPRCPGAGEGASESGEVGALQGVGDAAPERAQGGDADREGCGFGAAPGQFGCDRIVLGAWQGVEEGDVGWQVVALGWEVPGAQSVEAGLGRRV